MTRWEFESLLAHMSKKKVTVELVFDEVLEDDEVYYRFDYIDLAASELPEGYLQSVAEMWAQSDWYNVGFVNAFLEVLSRGLPMTREEISEYY